MVSKPIVYSRHATVRLRERRITRSDVRWLLARGIREATVGNPQQWTVRGYLGKHEVKLLFIEDSERYFIRTVMRVGGDE